jgi:hypothetical protein
MAKECYHWVWYGERIDKRTGERKSFGAHVDWHQNAAVRLTMLVKDVKKAVGVLYRRNSSRENVSDSRALRVIITNLKMPRMHIKTFLFILRLTM